MATEVYQPGVVQIAAATGTERVYVDNGGAVNVFLTTAQIAQLANDEGNLVETSITTVGNGTLTAPGLADGQIARTGPTAPFTDTLATAAQIVAALPSFTAGSTFIVRIKNGTVYQSTLNASAGVTLPGDNIIPPHSAWQAFGTIGGTAAAPTIVFTHLGTTPIYGTLQDAPQLLTAAGATQGSAAAITSLNAIISVSSTVSTRGVRLPVATTGLEVEIANFGAFGAKVYPATGCKIGANATNVADATLLPNTAIRYKAVSGTLWVAVNGVRLNAAQSFSSAQTFAGGLISPTSTVLAGTYAISPQILTAAGQTQGSATAITTLKAVITAYATATHNGVRLPVAATGLEVEVVSGVSPGGFKVYPAIGGKIASAVTNAADSTNLAAYKTNRYIAVNTTLWSVQRGA